MREKENRGKEKNLQVTDTLAIRFCVERYTFQVSFRELLVVVNLAVD